MVCLHPGVDHSHGDVVAQRKVPRFSHVHVRVGHRVVGDVRHRPGVVDCPLEGQQRIVGRDAERDFLGTHAAVALGIAHIRVPVERGQRPVCLGGGHADKLGVRKREPPLQSDPGVGSQLGTLRPVETRVAGHDQFNRVRRLGGRHDETGERADQHCYRTGHPSRNSHHHFFDPRPTVGRHQSRCKQAAAPIRGRPCRRLGSRAFGRRVGRRGYDRRSLGGRSPGPSWTSRSTT